MRKNVSIDRDSIFKKDILKRPEAAAYMGISLSYLDTLCSKRRIPYYKPTGRTSFFKRQELDDWLLQGRVSPHLNTDGSY